MTSESHCPAEVSVKAVQVLRDILPVAGTESTKELLNSLSPLLASLSWICGHLSVTFLILLQNPTLLCSQW